VFISKLWVSSRPTWGTGSSMSTYDRNTLPLSQSELHEGDVFVAVCGIRFVWVDRVWQLGIGPLPPLP
jgi:hypothetical protein